MGFIKALSYGGITAIIGLFIVFLGLTILIASIYVMAGVFKRVNAGKAAKEAAARAAAPAPAPVAAPAAEAPAEEEVTDPELIAVIAAAIAAFDSSNKNLVVRKVRRVSGWNRTARAEPVYRF